MDSDIKPTFMHSSRGISGRESKLPLQPLIILIIIAGVGAGVYFFAIQGGIEGIGPSADFDYHNLTITSSLSGVKKGSGNVNEYIIPGEEITISLDVSNVGEIRDTKTLKLKINDSIKQEKNVSLEGGEIKNISFELQTDKIPKKYEIEVGGLRKNFESAVFKKEVREGRVNFVSSPSIGSYSPKLKVPSASWRNHSEAILKIPYGGELKTLNGIPECSFYYETFSPKNSSLSYSPEMFFYVDTTGDEIGEWIYKAIWFCSPPVSHGSFMVKQWFRYKVHDYQTIPMSRFRHNPLDYSEYEKWTRSLTFEEWKDKNPNLKILYFGFALISCEIKDGFQQIICFDKIGINEKIFDLEMQEALETQR